jgi:ABC-type transport system involved in multi-copper enzyme maturation permease subunit
MLVILQRELLREARKRRSYLARLIATIIGFSIAVFLLLTSRGAGADGRWIFHILTSASFAFALIQGSNIAAGSIANEKRDGTLCLLLLTPLRPTGIVAGKLFAAGIPLIQAFLAFIPALTITALHGGVTGGEIIRATVVVASTLGLSLAAGLFVSSFSRRYATEGRTTIALLAVFLALSLTAGRGPISWLQYFSPWTAFQGIADTYYSASPGTFWLSLTALNFLSIALLVGAVFFLPRRWNQHEKIRTRVLPVASLSNEERTVLLDRSPAEWLALRRITGWLSQLPFFVFLATLSTIAALNPGSSFGLFSLLAGTVFLLIRLAAEASFPFSEARRSGATELLLCTPLNPASLVTGQVAALWRQFTAPAVIILSGGFFHFLHSNN